MTEAGTIVDRAASKRTRQNSPASLALLLPDLRESVQAPESEPPKGNLVEGAAVEVRCYLVLPCLSLPSQCCFRLAWAEHQSFRFFPPCPASLKFVDLTVLPPTVRIKGDREQKGHFTIKRHLYERAAMWKRLAPGSEL